jgi:hypothetical protein
VSATLSPDDLALAWPDLDQLQQRWLTRDRLGPYAPLSEDYTPRWYQLSLWYALVAERRRRVVEVMHRRGGKDFTVWNAFIWLANHWRVGTYFYSLPTYTQAYDTIWSGRTLDPSGILPSVKFLDCAPANLVARTNEQRMEIEFTNGSIIRLVGGDNYNRIVGTNPVAIAFSEWSLTDPQALDYFRPMITANDGIFAFLYTPRGHNHGREVYNTFKALAEQEPIRYFCELQTVKDTGAITEEAIERDKREGMSEAKVQQEYYCDFEVANEGSYYGRLMAEARAQGRIGLVPHDPALKVHTVWDVGVSDHTVIGFVQVKGNAIFAIDYYANHGEGLDHYLRVLDDRRRERGYRYGAHIGPHDIQQRSKNDGKSYRDYAADRGHRFAVLPPSALEAGIEATRATLPRIYFDQARTERWVAALEAYTKKWNDALHVWSDSPQHDWASHPADMTRYLAQAEKAGLLRDERHSWDRKPTTAPTPWVRQPEQKGWR